MQLCSQRQNSPTTTCQTTAHTILLQPTLERRRWWYMGYYCCHFTVEEFKTYHGEDGRWHFVEHKQEALTATMDFLIICNRDSRSFVWIHHSLELNWELLWGSML